MPDYKNIRVPEDVHADLVAEKREGETWGGLERRLLNALNSDIPDSETVRLIVREETRGAIEEARR